MDLVFLCSSCSLGTHYVDQVQSVGIKGTHQHTWFITGFFVLFLLFAFSGRTRQLSYFYFHPPQQTSPDQMAEGRGLIPTLTSQPPSLIPGNSRWLEFIAGQSPSPDKSRERNAYMFSTQLAFSLLRQFRIQTHSGLGLPTPINIIKTIPPDVPKGQQDLDNPPLRLFSR